MIKCPVSGKPIDKEIAADYKDAKVYFCCPGCPGPFEKDAAKFAAKANHQLVATKQYQQKACPISGHSVDKDVTAKVDGVKVAFCCPDCQGKVEKAKDPEKLALLFAEKPFKQGFEKMKKQQGQEKTEEGAKSVE